MNKIVAVIIAAFIVCAGISRVGWCEGNERKFSVGPAATILLNESESFQSSDFTSIFGVHLEAGKNWEFTASFFQGRFHRAENTNDKNRRFLATVTETYSYDYGTYSYLYEVTDQKGFSVRLDTKEEYRIYELGVNRVQPFFKYFAVAGGPNLSFLEKESKTIAEYDLSILPENYTNVSLINPLFQSKSSHDVLVIPGIDIGFRAGTFGNQEKWLYAFMEGGYHWTPSIPESDASMIGGHHLKNMSGPFVRIHLGVRFS